MWVIPAVAGYVIYKDDLVFGAQARRESLRGIQIEIAMGSLMWWLLALVLSIFLIPLLQLSYEVFLLMPLTGAVIGTWFSMRPYISAAQQNHHGMYR